MIRNFVVAERDESGEHLAVRGSELVYFAHNDDPSELVVFRSAAGLPLFHLAEDSRVHVVRVEIPELAVNENEDAVSFCAEQFFRVSNLTVRFLH
jgi:hypothetical protein